MVGQNEEKCPWADEERYKEMLMSVMCLGISQLPAPLHVSSQRATTPPRLIRRPRPGATCASHRPTSEALSRVGVRFRR